jgi:hypothetical protein
MNVPDSGWVRLRRALEQLSADEAAIFDRVEEMWYWGGDESEQP